MKNAILVPGRPDRDEHYDPNEPSNSNNHWFPWLSRQLILKDIHTVAVELPMPFSSRYDIWKKEFERFDINSDTILVGHSCGGGFLLRWLSEHKNVNVDKVILVAPWINPDNDPSSDTADFFDFKLDADLASRTAGLVVFSSTNDSEPVKKTVEIIKGQVSNAKIIEFKNKGHFCKEDLGTVEFPELLEEAIKR